VLSVFKQWVQRYLSDPQAILLIVLLGGSLLLFMCMGRILAPMIASVVIAYLLEWFANLLVKLRIPRNAAMVISYGTFLGLFLSAIFILWPIIWQQLLRLYEEIPSMILGIQHFFTLLPEKFPEFLTKETVEGWVSSFLVQVKQSGKVLFTVSIATLPAVIALIVYLVLVPLMVFFFLKDRYVITRWLSNFLPNDRRLLVKVWKEVDEQIGNYIRGKVAEVVIVGMATYILFYFFELRYAILMAVLVGFSVLIPYIGAALVTIPVVLVAFFQWGLGHEFAYLILCYGILMTLDGIILVPLLFSEAVSLHPVAIIIAVLVFGGWWGFWGVFFAIPLATLVKALIDAWPRGKPIKHKS